MEAERAEHGLTALEIGYEQRGESRLDPDEGMPELACRLRSPDLPDVEWNVAVPGLGSVTARPEPVELDLSALVARLAGTDGVRRQQASAGPLWLAVTAEHPILPAVDWESGLADLAMPLLRLPGRIGAPTPPPRHPRIALCVSMPAAKEDFDVAGIVARAVDAVLASVPTPPEVHLFSDASMTPVLRGLQGPSVIVHDPIVEGPHEPASRGFSSGGRVEQPWLRWIARTMADGGLDVLHLIGHGFTSSCDGAFAVAESPAHDFDSTSARFVWAPQVTALLADLGGWGLVVTAVPRNFSLAGLRLLGTQVGGQRSAAVACQDAERTAPGALSDVYRALFAYPVPPPATPGGLMMMMHPERFGSTPLAPPPYVPGRSLLADLVDGPAVVPADLVGARRQIAQWENQLAVRSSTDHLEDSRAGLELAKSRLDQVLRDTGTGEGFR